MHFTRRVIFLAALIFITFSCRNSSRSELKLTQVKQVPAKKEDPSSLYGIPADSFDLVQGHIKNNEFISGILLQHGVSPQEIDKAVKGSITVFDVRNVRSGNKYILYCDRDNARAKYLVYEHNPTTCYVFSFNDSVNITCFRKEIRHEVEFASGTIETSLWDAMIGHGLRPSLVAGLSDLFAWSVDFFGLQTGDSFKVIYEELFIGDQSLGTGRIYGASFTSNGATVNAIPFIQNNEESYFNSDGNSLKKAFLKAPLQFYRITSRFSASRMHPILRIRRPHFGVDYAAPVGTPVHSIGDGRVTLVGMDNGAGRIVRIQHNSVYATTYMHLSSFAEGIKAGVHVKQNDVIGFVGSSGLATGPHLDFRIYMNGSPVDPLKVDAPPVEPVSPENLERFGKEKSVILSLLETIDL